MHSDTTDSEDADSVGGNSSDMVMDDNEQLLKLTSCAQATIVTIFVDGRIVVYTFDITNTLWTFYMKKS